MGLYGGRKLSSVRVSALRPDDTGQPSVAAAVARLGTESAFAVLARAQELERQGREIVHLEIGEPDFPTPAHVGEAAIASIRAGETHYAPAAGMAELREAAASHLTRSRGIAIEPARVLVANGAKPFILFTVLALCEPGDEVVVPDPGFPIYASAVRWAGATPVALRLREAHGFGFDLEELGAALSERTKLVILNSPNNPTGGVQAAAQLAQAARMIMQTRAWVLSDEIYAQIAYGEEVSSIATVEGMAERTVLLDGLSKAYAMTGWRCGYAAVPERLIDPLTRLIVNSTSCVPPFVQRAAIAALDGPQESVEEMVAQLRDRRDLVVDALNALPGVSCATPSGAFYAFPDVSGVPLPAESLADRLLDEAGVAVLAGSGFGPGGVGHLRISYAASRATLALGMERIGELIAGLPR